jgi:hypothetical protein
MDRDTCLEQSDCLKTAFVVYTTAAFVVGLIGGLIIGALAF